MYVDIERGFKVFITPRRALVDLGTDGCSFFGVFCFVYLFFGVGTSVWTDVHIRLERRGLDGLDGFASRTRPPPSHSAKYEP